MCYYSLDFLVSYVVARLWSPAPNILLVMSPTLLSSLPPRREDSCPTGYGRMHCVLKREYLVK